MSKQPSEPILVAFARTRFAWFRVWAEIGIMMTNSAHKKMNESVRVITDWEREVREWGHEGQSD